MLTKREFKYLHTKLKRQPNELEKEIVGAEWSEHCSYKSSKKLIRLLPSKGKRVLVGPGYDAGVIDVGDNYVITIHIESHNHPSAIEPFGGAATGVGGVIRDIISMGTVPIALLNALRFGNIDLQPSKARKKISNLKKLKSTHITDPLISQARWLFKNTVRGIASYGNCIGIPTIGGEIEFDDSFDNYCLVDVASIGFGRKDKIIQNKVDNNDVIILAGGLTGRDGIHGASFASKDLEDDQDRSAVQIPDPFLEKLLMDVTREAVDNNLLKAVKDLGGGGLSCCLSETSSNLGKGFEVDLSQVLVKYDNMTPTEIMISESQERMLYVTDNVRFNKLIEIIKKYDISFSVIGKVKDHKDLVIKKDNNTIAKMPSTLIAHAPLLDRKSRKPRYIKNLNSKKIILKVPRDLQSVILNLLSDPTISNKKWVFQQYDHEIGLRTIVKPGISDSAVLKLTQNKFLAAKLDGNSKLCYLDPFVGTLSCLSEARRNLVCSGAYPIGIVDHLQFGNPENPEIFWTFKKSIQAIISFSKYNKIPVVGGKVSFYNETKNGPIKPSPVIGMIGLIENSKHLTKSIPNHDDTLYIIGNTCSDMGGSEYYEYINSITGGYISDIDLKIDAGNSRSVIDLIRNGLVSCSHDCSKGGLAITLSEMAIGSGYGIDIDVGQIPTTCKRIDDLLFSETPSRFIIGTKKPDELERRLKTYRKLKFSRIGKVSEKNNEIIFRNNKNKIIGINIDEAKKYYNNISNLMEKEG